MNRIKQVNLGELMLKVAISVVAGVAAAAVLWMAMQILGGVVDFLYPVQYSMSDAPRAVYGFLKWVVPIAGGIAAAIAGYVFAGRIDS